MPQFRVKGRERAIVLTVYMVEADDAADAEAQCKNGEALLESYDVEEIQGGWIETVKVTQLPEPEEVRKLEADYTKALNAMHARVQQACHAAGHDRTNVRYAAYRMGIDPELPIDNLDEVPIQGTFRLVMSAGPSGMAYQSPPLRNPTWLEVSVYANEMIAVVGFGDHVFLEGVDKSPIRTGPDGVPCYRFHMGS